MQLLVLQTDSADLRLDQGKVWQLPGCLFRDVNDLHLPRDKQQQLIFYIHVLLAETNTHQIKDP